MLAGLFAGSIALHSGCNAMSSDKLELKWEWPAGRPVAARMLVRIDDITRTSTGLFGIGKSPSIEGNLPDARTVTATVLAGPGDARGRTLSLKLPGPEAQKLHAQQNAGLALIAGGQVVVCVAAAPAGDEAAQAAWLAGWNCPVD
ncbi:MAG TPA: hypothetical protein VF457_12925 [Burkholderiaceae bacterium]